MWLIPTFLVFFYKGIALQNNLLPSTSHPAGTGLKKKIRAQKTNHFFFFEEHTSVIIKNFKTEIEWGLLEKIAKKS